MGADNDAGTQPAVLADCYRIARLYSLSALQIVDRVVGRYKLAVRTNQRVSADGYQARVEHRAVIVYEDILAELYAVAMVAVERWVNGCRCRDAWYKFFDNLAIVGIQRRHRLQASAEPVSMLYAFHRFCITEVVQLAVAHFLKFSHKRFLNSLFRVQIYIKQSKHANNVTIDLGIINTDAQV